MVFRNQMETRGLWVACGSFFAKLVRNKYLKHTEFCDIFPKTSFFEENEKKKHFSVRPLVSEEPSLRAIVLTPTIR